MDHQTASEWLCRCLKVDPDPATASELLVLSSADWDRILALAAEHKVMPLLHHRLKALDRADGFPPEVVQRLRESYWDSAGTNIRLYHGLAQVLAALQDAGILTVVLKGAHLAPIVYGNVALRPMTDVDLLIRRQDLVRAGERLLDMGYAASTPSWREAADAASQHLPPFTKPGAPWIELHRTIVDPIGPQRQVFAPFQEIDVDGLWKRARPSTTPDLEALTLSPEDLLLHLCLHIAFQDRFRVGLRALYDVALAIRHYQTDMDWEQLELRARAWKADRCVYLTLRLARELLGAAVPCELLDAPAFDGFDPRFVTWAKEQVLGERSAGLPDMRNLALLEGASVLRKASIAFKTAFPAPEVMAALYPVSPHSKRVYLYYPARFRDLLRKYGRTAWRMMRRDRGVVTAAAQQNRLNALVEWMSGSQPG
jgi:hypothetical protein